MRVRNRKKKNKKHLLLLLVAVISIGFASLAINLYTRGNIWVAGRGLNIRFENIIVSDKGVEPNYIGISDDTFVMFDASFKNPGEYLEFTVDAVNYGEIDAMVDSIINVNLDSEQKKYIEVKATYADDTPIKKSELLEAGRSLKYKVILKYKIPQNENEILDVAKSSSFTFGVQYVKADASATKKELNAVALQGKQFNQKIIEMSGSNYNNVVKVKYFRRSSELPEEYTTDSNIVSAKNSAYPIYAWVEGDTLYYYTDTEKIALNEDASHMFDNTVFVELDTSDWDTTNVKNMSFLFYQCEKLEILNLSGLNTENATNLSALFGGCSKLESIDLSTISTKNATDISSMFGGCSKLTSIDVSNFNTSKVKDMSGLFGNCSSLQSVDLEKFKTGNVTDMSYMFNGCTSLASIDITKFDTSNVTEMMYMFNRCSLLTSIDLSKIDTSKVTEMNGMFYDCTNLTKLDLTKFDTRNVTSFSSMFRNCKNLASIDLSSFITDKADDMYFMFSGCSSLEELDLSTFNTKNVVSFNAMFSNCTSLKKILVSYDFVVTRSSMGTFENCVNLKGGNGSQYNSSKITSDYAKIDGYSYDSETGKWVEDGSFGYLTFKA